MKSINYPKVTYAICSYNGGELLRKCLSSIQKQKYPKNKIEILVVDDDSTDNSVSIAKSFKAKVLRNGHHDNYIGQKIALHNATGEFFYILDQDIELRNKNFTIKMVKPLIENTQLTGSFTRAYPHMSQPWVTRFISYQPTQCDPLFEYLTPSIQSTIIQRKKTYDICKFVPGNIPPESRMFYRLNILKKTKNWKMKKIYDHDLQIVTVKAGFDLFAYVPTAGIYHHHASSLESLVKKRMRNLTVHYFPMQKSLSYRWIDTGDKFQIIRMFLWVLYANLFIPAAIRGFLRFLKYRDWALLMEPVITIATTDGILFTFLKEKGGRKLIVQLLNPLNIKRTGSFGQ